jgi:hypothetical protein
MEARNSRQTAHDLAQALPNAAELPKLRAKLKLMIPIKLIARALGELEGWRPLHQSKRQLRSYSDLSGSKKCYHFMVGRIAVSVSVGIRTTRLFAAQAVAWMLWPARAK